MKETKRPGQQLKGLSVQELLGVTNEESAMEIELRLIHPWLLCSMLRQLSAATILQRFIMICRIWRQDKEDV